MPRDELNNGLCVADRDPSICPYAARLEAWLDRHLDQQWPPVDPTASEAACRRLVAADQTAVLT